MHAAPVARRRAVFYGLLSFGFTVIHNIFLLYHVEFFQNEYEISPAAFMAGEAVFMVWNSVNDPLFGWLSDVNSEEGAPSSHSRVRRRLRTIRYGGVALALSFLSFWFPWAPPWLQFVTCLCLYDSFLTLVELNQQALLVDLSIHLHDRTAMASAASVLSVFGCGSVFFSYWARGDAESFRAFVLVVASLSAGAFVLGTAGLQRSLASLPEDPAATSHHIATKGLTVREYAGQTLRHRNFLWFSAMNVVQVFHCHFNSNFFPVFLRHLLGTALSADLGSALLGLSFVVPHINNVFFSRLANDVGVYSVVRALFATKLALALVMALLGADRTLLLGLFIASNRIFTEGTCKLLNLAVGDLVDEDYVINQRTQPIAALVFGTSNLLSKPGQTLAPVLGTLFLRARGYSADALFAMLVAVPAACGAVQLACWARFTLHGARLREVKHAIVLRTRDQPV